MTKLYQLLNDEYQSVKIFKDLDEAKRYLNNLKEAFADKFYIIELTVVYSL